MEILRHTVRRAAPGTHVARADARRPPLRERAMDAVLVDAPCSATGTMARHPDARWRLTLRRIERLAGLQRDVLEGACRAVRPGGLLVYLTCSLEPEENEEQVDAFLARHPEFHREGPDRRIFPSDHGTDGGYGARLRHAS
jgi:16S rRNA (cytosine967-C5)-methyltransferase